MRMKEKFILAAALLSAMLFGATNSFAFGPIGTSVNTACAVNDAQPYTGDCSLCHVSNKGDWTDAMVAADAGGAELLDYFCPAPTAPPCTDSDNDSYAKEGGSCGQVDCDDSDADVYPGATEIANNGIDEDCNGSDLIDVTLLDGDGDGVTPADGDCDDSDADVYPGATEIANNGIDEDCSGSDLVDVTLLDGDGDGVTPAAGDCDDSDAGVYPGADEICTDNIDNDCNDLVDDMDPNAVDCPIVCTDSDRDSYALEGGDCGQVDCNDNDAAINPAAAENCTDNIDNDCDGYVDVADLDAEGCPSLCTDSDGDTYAAQGGDCGPVDCDDTNAGVYPGAEEIANNGIDEDCSGADSVDTSIVDNDGDTYSVAAGDCDDYNAAINPGADDIANNGIDEDCNGWDLVDVTLLDNDGDGFTPAAGDCDDTDGTVNPDAEEICTDGMDNDCNGMVDTQDEGAIDCPIACTDRDGDSYAFEGGDCGPIDCDDQNGAVNPGAVELCDDLIDNDCDELIDEGCDRTCPDNDSDGYADASCGGTDCDDTDPAVNPAAAEVCGNDIDENCNGASDDVCTSCPDGAQLQVRTAEYDYEKRSLKISGLADSKTTVTLLDIDSGSILAADLKVRRGRFYVKERGLDPDEVPVKVAAINEEGCVSAELQVSMENMLVERDDHERDDHERDDHERYDYERDDD